MLNIAEGFARKTRREFCQFLVISHGSVAEVQAALYVALDQEYLSELKFKELYGLADETSKMTLGLINYLRKNGGNGVSGDILEFVYVKIKRRKIFTK